MLNNTPRGAVSNKSRAIQARDFTGLLYGNITPTDIDGVIEYKNRCYVFYEAKHMNAPPMSDGQRIALERICDDLHKQKPTLLILCIHTFPVNVAINFAVCDVERYRYNGRWWEKGMAWKNGITVKELTDRFLRFCDLQSIRQ